MSGDENRVPRRRRAPKLEATAQSVGRFAGWLAKETAAGRLSPTAAKLAEQSARLMLAAVRVEIADGEMTELRALVERAEGAARALGARVVEHRQSSAEDTPGIIGQWVVGDDGKLVPSGGNRLPS